MLKRFKQIYGELRKFLGRMYWQWKVDYLEPRFAVADANAKQWEEDHPREGGMIIQLKTEAILLRKSLNYAKIRLQELQ